MKCDFVTDLGDRQNVSFGASETQDNKNLWASTPNGRLDLGNISKSNNFKPGKEYIIEISEKESV